LLWRRHGALGLARAAARLRRQHAAPARAARAAARAVAADLAAPARRQHAAALLFRVRGELFVLSSVFSFVLFLFLFFFLFSFPPQLHPRRPRRRRRDDEHGAAGNQARCAAWT